MQKKLLKYIFINLILIQLFVPAVSISALFSARIKDIVDVEGVRENILMGYGLVVGLNGTGDNLNNVDFTKKGLIDVLNRLGVNSKGSDLKTKNVAAVTVTATLPAFARYGNKIDVNVSTIGDAKSLQGGTLIATPLLGADGMVYAVAQGPITVPGFTASGKDGTSVSRGVSTNSFIPGGGIVENEVHFDFNALKSFRISLKNPDISTSLQIARVINDRFGEKIAKSTDPGNVIIDVPKAYDNNVVSLLAKMEQIEVIPDTVAKIIIEESSGTIVIGENVRISPVAISQGNLTIKISERETVSQPGAFAPASAQTQVIQNSQVSVIDEGKGKKMIIIDGNTTLKELVDGLNALGVSSRDLISILENIKASGALQAQIHAR
jgi:flagellar P-ring protein precursor FlgI